MTEIEKDAARYRWLRDRLQVRYEASIAGDKRAILTMRVGHGFLDSNIRPEHGWTDPRYFDECREKVDAAIDAAVESYNAAMTGPAGVHVHEPVGQKPRTEGDK